MEQINRVEIRGIIGNVKLTKLSQFTVARMSVATNVIYKDHNGNAVIETTWHTVVAWESKDIPVSTLEGLTKGDTVHLAGRLRSVQYTGSDGEMRTSPEVLAKVLTKVDTSVCPQAERVNE